MARTYNDIYYNDDENSTAEILDDMKKLAESVDQQIGSIKSFNNDTSQFIEQVTPLMNNLSEQVIDMHQLADTMFTELEQVKEENKQLREDLESDYEEKTVEGTDIEVNDSAEMRAKLKICGNYRQETRSGKNELKLDDNESTINNIKFKTEEGKISIIGTATEQIQGYYININKEFKQNYVLSIDRKGTYTGLSINIQYEKNGQTKYATISDTFKFESGDVLKLIYFIVNNSSAVNAEIYLQLEQGSTATEWEEYGATPTPEIPSKIEAVGSNIQLFDKNNINKLNAYIDTNNKIINAKTTRTLYIQITGGLTYTISKRGQTLRLATSKDIPNFNVEIKDYKNYDGINEATITTSKEQKYLILYYWNSNNTLTEQEILDSIKICEGTSTREYSEYGQGCASVKIQNKNLFDENNKISGLTISSDGKIISNNERELIIIKVKPNTVYTFSRATPTESGNVVWGISDNKPFVNEKCTYNIMASSITNIQIKTGIKTKYIIFRTSKDNGITNNKYYIKAMIEENKVATNYISHEEQSFTMPCQKEMIDKEDYFDIKNYKEVHNWGKYEFTGNENIGYNSTNKTFYTDANLVSNHFYNETIATYLCSHFSAIPTSQRYKNNTFFINVGHVINLTTDMYTSIDTFKIFLKAQYNAGTPVTIYYQLATPEILDMTLEQKRVSDEIEKAKSYYETTIVTSEDEIQPNLEFTYKRSNKLRVENLEKALLSTGGGV